MEKQEKKTSKIKTWWEKNKHVIARKAETAAWYAGGFILGSWATRKMTIWAIERGLFVAHTEGMIKFFDPSNGLEVPYDEAGELLMNRAKK